MNGQRSRILIKLCLILSAFCLLFGFTAAGAYLYFQTSSGKQYLLTKIQDVLSENNIKFSWKELSFNPFSSVHIESLELTRNEPGNEFLLKAEVLEANFSWSLLSRSLDVSKARLVHPIIQVKQGSRSSGLPSGSKASTSDELSKPSFKLPFDLAVQKAEIKGLDFDLDWNTADAGTKAHGSQIDLNAELTWKALKMRLIGSSEISQPTFFEAWSKAPAGKNQVRGKLKWKGEFEGELKLDRLHWVYSFRSKEAQVELPEIAVSKKSGAESIETELNQVQVSAHSQIRMRTPRLFEFAQPEIEECLLTGKVSTAKGSVSQSLDSKRSRIEFDSQQLELDTNFASLIQSNIHYFVKNLKFMPKNLIFSSGEVHLKGESSTDLRLVKWSGEAKIDKKPLVNISLQANLARIHELIPLEFSADLSQVFQKFLGLPWMVSLQGNMDVKEANDLVKLKARLQVKNENSNWSVGTDSQVQGIFRSEKMQLIGSSTIGQASDSTQNPLDTPVTIEYNASLNKGVEFSGRATAKISHLDIPTVGKLSGGQADLHLSIPDTSLPKMEADFHFSQNELRLDRHFSKVYLSFLREVPPPLGRVEGSFKVGISGSSFKMRDFTLGFDGELMKVSAEATGDVEKKNFQTQGMFKVRTPDKGASVLGHEFKGKVDLPWTLAVYKGRNILIDGTVSIEDFSWTKLPTQDSPLTGSISGVSGKIPVSEQLLWDGTHIRFAELIHQNPFERVDFERVQPMIHESEKVFAQELQVDEKKYGPFQGFFSMRQNMIFAHKFDLKVGSGRTFGEMYFDFYPANIQIGMLSRMTGFNLTEILPRKYLIKKTLKDEPLSGRSGVVLNLNNGSIDGRVDITEMGGEQLITLINILDPKYENDQMNKARFALGIAYPSFIQMSFQRGYLDMGIQVSGAINQNFQLRGLPISPWISSSMAGVTKMTQEGPLK